MKRVFETAECEVVRNSIFWELRYEKQENQVKGCGMELRVSDLQMNAIEATSLQTSQKYAGDGLWMESYVIHTIWIFQSYVPKQRRAL